VPRPRTGGWEVIEIYPRPLDESIAQAVALLKKEGVTPAPVTPWSR
jgi:hypothetical protein